LKRRMFWTNMCWMTKFSADSILSFILAISDSLANLTNLEGNRTYALRDPVLLKVLLDEINQLNNSRRESEDTCWMNDLSFWLILFGQSFVPFWKSCLMTSMRGWTQQWKVSHWIHVLGRYVSMWPLQSWGCRVKWEKTRELYWRS
jgi:hypothetical protein